MTHSHAFCHTVTERHTWSAGGLDEILRFQSSGRDRTAPGDSLETFLRASCPPRTGRDRPRRPGGGGDTPSWGAIGLISKPQGLSVE